MVPTNTRTPESASASQHVSRALQQQALANDEAALHCVEKKGDDVRSNNTTEGVRTSQSTPLSPGIALSVLATALQFESEPDT